MYRVAILCHRRLHLKGVGVIQQPLYRIHGTIGRSMSIVEAQIWWEH